MKSRYEDSQRLLWGIKEGCFFLTLLSIAEEERQRLEITPSKIDLIEAVRECRNRGWIKADFYILNDCAILSYYTGEKCTRRKSPTIGKLFDNEYSLEKWTRGENTHFRRRYFDVYNNSATVSQGTRECYYIYRFEK